MKKKICFVGLSNIQAIPYLYKYVELLNCEYDIIYWDRICINEDCGAINHYAMKYKVNKANKTKINKIIGYLKFKRYATQILKNANYDGIILLTGNVAVLLRKILKKKYNKKYIVDIRDYYKESQKWYFNAEKDVLDSSGMAVISSKAFKAFLPKHKYYVVHNSQNISEEQIIKFRTREKAEPTITISFIGGIRFYDQLKRVIEYFANDDRYLIKFIGYGANVLKGFCEEKDIKNVFLYDSFPPEKTIEYYYDTDIIMNLYGNNTPLLDYALSNKLYYAAQLGMPILVCPNTYMEKVAVGNGFGFTFDLENKSMSDKLYEYYKSIDWVLFYENCEKFMAEVFVEEKEFCGALGIFLLKL